jgi:hypothetical protein
MIWSTTETRNSEGVGISRAIPLSNTNQLWGFA